MSLGQQTSKHVDRETVDQWLGTHCATCFRRSGTNKLLPRICDQVSALVGYIENAAGDDGAFPVYSTDLIVRPELVAGGWVMRGHKTAPCVEQDSIGDNRRGAA